MSTQQLTGCVKWFDNNLNYGFVTVLSHGVYQNNDIFVHQSNIKTKRDCYRTLYTGECVQFDITKSDNERHPYHAINVSGFNNVPLHCENPNYRVYNNNNGNSRRGRGGYVNHNQSHGYNNNNNNNRSYNKSWNRSTSDNVILRNQSQNLQEEHSTTNLEEQNTNTQQTSSNSQVVVNDSTQSQPQPQAQPQSQPQSQPQAQTPKNASIEIAATTNTTPQKRGKGRGKAH